MHLLGSPLMPRGDLALLAVPLLVALNVCCDHIEKLKPYGAFLKNEVPKARAG